MLLTYRFKLAPTKAQYDALDQLCDDQRKLYNAALQERIDAWKKSGISVTKLDQFKSLTVIRSFDETYSAVPVAMSRWSISRVDDALKGFFSRVAKGQKPGFPRFKARALEELRIFRVARHPFEGWKTTVLRSYRRPESPPAPSYP